MRYLVRLVSTLFNLGTRLELGLGVGATSSRVCIESTIFCLLFFTFIFFYVQVGTFNTTIKNGRGRRYSRGGLGVWPGTMLICVYRVGCGLIL